MKQVIYNELTFSQFENLGRESKIQHVITQRAGNNGSEFSLSLSSLPDKSIIETNRTMLCAALKIDSRKLFLPSQIHGTRAVEVTSATSRKDLLETDALMTSEPGICIGVMSADCVPVLIFDKRNRAVAAIHAGWRGTVKRIVGKTLQRMSEVFGTRGEDVIAGIGPSAGPQVYEVGAEVIENFSRSLGDHGDLLTPTRPGHALLDLWAANRLQLLEFGVDETAIETSGICTITNNDKFFSARKGDKGRFAAVIMIRS